MSVGFPLDMHVGQFVGIKRRKLGLSAREASLRAGLSPSYVSKLEAHGLECSLKAFASLAWALHLTKEEIALIVKSEGPTTQA